MNQNSKKSNHNEVALFFKEVVITILIVASLVFLLCLFLGNQKELQEAIDLKPAVGDRAIGLFSVYVAVSLAIESALEIYLKVFRESKPTDTQEKQDNNQNQKDFEVKRIATITSLIVGIAVSLAGVRFLEPFFEIKSSGYQAILFHALDILLTAGLLSGGSDGIHQLTSFYRQRIDNSKSK